MKELYKQTFSHLHASGNAFQEAGQMKTGRIRKSLVIGAAAAALMATAASAANAATDGAFFAHILSFTIPGGVDNVSYNDDGTITQSCISRTQQRMKSPRQKKTEADLQNSLKRKLGNRLPFCYCRSMILSQSRLPVCIPYERS